MRHVRVVGLPRSGDPMPQRQLWVGMVLRVVEPDRADHMQDISDSMLWVDYEEVIAQISAKGDQEYANFFWKLRQTPGGSQAPGLLIDTSLVEFVSAEEASACWMRIQAEQPAAAVLFQGEPSFTGPSNFREIVEACPATFRNPKNEWFVFAKEILSRGVCLDNWEWKTSEGFARSKQFACFHSLYRLYDWHPQNSPATLAWMLSEMLVKVPEHLHATASH